MKAVIENQYGRDAQLESSAKAYDFFERVSNSPT
jgi:hypothetical protein